MRRNRRRGGRRKEKRRRKKKTKTNIPEVASVEATAMPRSAPSFGMMQPEHISEVKPTTEKTRPTEKTWKDVKRNVVVM